MQRRDRRGVEARTQVDPRAGDAGEVRVGQPGDVHPGLGAHRGPRPETGVDAEHGRAPSPPSSSHTVTGPRSPRSWTAPPTGRHYVGPATHLDGDRRAAS